jgi:hypothetical protein
VPLSGNEIEVVDVDLDRDNLRYTEIKIPTTFSLGLGFGEEQRWLIGGEYSFQQFSDFSNDCFLLLKIEWHSSPPDCGETA